MFDIKNSKICIIILLLIISCKSQADKDVDEVRKLFQNDRYEEAIQLASKSIEKHPNDARLYYNRGYCYHVRSSDKKAMDDFTNCIRIDPKYHNGYYGLAMVYESKNEFDLAEKNYNKAIELAPDNERKSVFTDGLAGLYASKKDFKKAIEITKKAIELQDEGGFYSNLGLYLLLDGQKKEAESAWLKAISEKEFKQIEFKYSTYAYLASFYFQQKDYKKSKENIEKAIELAPNNKQYISFFNQVKKYVK